MRPMLMLATSMVKSSANPAIVLEFLPMIVFTLAPTVTYTFMPTVGVGNVSVTPAALMK
jgi:hypothetical protein